MLFITPWQMPQLEHFPTGRSVPCRVSLFPCRASLIRKSFLMASQNRTPLKLWTCCFWFCLTNIQHLLLQTWLGFQNIQEDKWKGSKRKLCHVRRPFLYHHDFLRDSVVGCLGHGPSHDELLISGVQLQEALSILRVAWRFVTASCALLSWLMYLVPASPQFLVKQAVTSSLPSTRRAQHCGQLLLNLSLPSPPLSVNPSGCMSRRH